MQEKVYSSLTRPYYTPRPPRFSHLCSRYPPYIPQNPLDTSHQSSFRLEGVVLRRDLLLEKGHQEGYLQDDVVPYFGHLGKEEESEEAGDATEAAKEGTTGVRQYNWS